MNMNAADNHSRQTPSQLSMSVVVPTYQRPDYLDRCVRSLFTQSRLPDEIILVSRDTDAATNRKIIELQDEFNNLILIRNPQIVKAGFLPPIQRGIEVAQGDIVVFLDDDAAAFPEWLGRIAAHYEDQRVGGVGGRYVNYFDFKLIEYPPASKVGKLSWYGRPVGNMYMDTTFTEPVSVDFFIGGNMSFRRSLLQQVRVDPVLNENVAFHWEMDMGQQVKKLGFTLLFDPGIKVNHYSAPREISGLRTVNRDGVYYSNLNYAYLMMKHLTLPRKCAYLLYTFMIGSQRSSGLLQILVQLIRGRGVDWRNDLLPSLKGRVTGVLLCHRKINP